MELNNFQTGSIGFMSSSVVSFMHLQDIIVAFLLGFVGAMGAWLFKYLVEKLKKQRLSPKIFEKIYISLFITIEKKLNNFNLYIYYE